MLAKNEKSSEIFFGSKRLAIFKDGLFRYIAFNLSMVSLFSCKIWSLDYLALDFCSAFAVLWMYLSSL